MRDPASFGILQDLKAGCSEDLSADYPSEGRGSVSKALPSPKPARSGQHLRGLCGMRGWQRWQGHCAAIFDGAEIHPTCGIQRITYSVLHAILI